MGLFRRLFLNSGAARHLPAVVLGLLLASAPAGAALAIDLPLDGLRAGNGRLVYAMEVTNPGTRSQGWIGTLYGFDGGEIMVPPGETVSVGFETYVSVACTVPWEPCGMIHAAMHDWMQTHNANVIVDNLPWRFELRVTAEGSRSEGWWGALLHEGTAVGDVDSPVETPMGPFVLLEGAMMWGSHGWFPVALAGGG